MTVLVIGAGWSGLTTAVLLARQGQSVQVVESAKHLGGRARSVQWQNKTIDNGQHILIGAYQQSLAMMQMVGVDLYAAFERLTIDLSIHDTHYSPLQLSAAGRLPWPWSLAWNLVRSAGLPGIKHLITLQRSIPKLLAKSDITVFDWLQTTKQPERLIKQLWEPLCLATLNTSINHASAHVLAHVLRDSLGRDLACADLLIPKKPLGALFPEPAGKFIQQHGGQISLQTRIAEIVTEEGQVTGAVTTNGRFIDAQAIVVATSPDQSAQLLASHVRYPRPLHMPITTVYLQYPANCHLPKTLLGLTGTVSHWLFDRNQQHPGMIAVVISGQGQHEKLDNDELIAHVSAEIQQHFSHFPTKPNTAFVIREKRATFMCTVENHRQRPTTNTDIAGLFLAGDYVKNNYPATIEGAVLNGQRCAEMILEENM